MATVIIHLTDVGDTLNIKFHSDPKPGTGDLTAAQYYGLWAMDAIEEQMGGNAERVLSVKETLDDGETFEN